MKEIVVISGKGGTGKTSLTASFAALADKAVMVDCDVDAPNLAIVMDPRIEQTSPFVGGKVAVLDPEACNSCGTCVEACRFGALSLDGRVDGQDDETVVVDAKSCEGCGVCVEVCPGDAMRMEPVTGGEWFISRTRHGTLVHARLGIGEDNSGKLVSLVRKEARALAERESFDLLISDGPPGIGCPVIASVSGVDLVLIVVEPTVSAIHDFERVVELTRHFGIPALVCVNKFDLNPTLADSLETLAARLGVEAVGRVPYDKVVVDAQLDLKSVIEYSNDDVCASIRDIWKKVEALLVSGKVRRERNLEAR